VNAENRTDPLPGTAAALRAGLANLECDVLVIGSGAGGLSAAVKAAYEGLTVIVVEKDAVCGGATSWSGGWAWTPGTFFAQNDGVNEDTELFRSYIKAVIGDKYDDAKLDAFFAAAPEMVDFLHNKTSMQFVPGTKIRDIYGTLPGAGTGHRSVGAKPFSLYGVRRDLRKIMRKQLYETSFLGMGIMAGPDLTKFLSASQGSIAGLWHAFWRFAQYVIDMVFTGRGMHTVNGTALTGRLMKSADDLGVRFLVSSPARELTTDSAGRVTGAIVETPQGERTITAARGVVLAAGGFPNNVEMRKQLFPRNTTGTEHWSLAPASANGDGIRLGQSVGAHFKTDMQSPVAWCPVSLVPYSNGTVGTFPHIMDRAKPGSIGVLDSGKRFVNEANGYYDYVDAMVKTVPARADVHSWQIADSTFVRKYPLGMAKPRPVPLFNFVRIGYLKKGRTLAELAQKCGIDAEQLQHTVNLFNQNARAGIDPDFERGLSEFNKYGGDPTVGPNPSLAPITKGPFYAVWVVPGSFGTFAGLAANANAQVLNEHGTPIAGLYVAGNDHASIMGGFYPAGGINLGPALTFGYIAGRHLAQA
jgi:succinate dehydrogenase/fumarate reductase flavoprotein subunit